LFPFLIGRIRTIFKEEAINVQVGEFPFLIGRIRTKRGKGTSKRNRNVSIPHR